MVFARSRNAWDANLPPSAFFCSTLGEHSLCSSLADGVVLASVRDRAAPRIGYRFAAHSPTVTRPVGGVPRQYSAIRFAVPVDLHNGGIVLSGTYDAPSA